MAGFDFTTDSWDLTPPGDLVDNIRFRIALREWCCASKPNQRWVIQKCLKDIKFWINTFCFGHDPRPRKGLPPVVPFILRSHQIEIVDSLREHLGHRDIGVRKSRGEGLSYLSLMLFLHSWCFEPDRNFLILSRTAISADAPNDSSSLGWKLDSLIKTLPQWMTGERGTDWSRGLQNHTWTNHRNGSQIVSTTNTGDVGAGGRCTAILMDEFSRFSRDTDILITTEPVTECRIFCSTFVGNQNEFYKLMHEDSNLIKMRLLWRNNPDRNRSMFIPDVRHRRLLKPGTSLEILKSYREMFFVEHLPILRKRGYALDDKNFPLNPWCVSRMIRPRMTPAIFSQEYEGIVADESSTFFPSIMIDQLLCKAEDPTWVGDIVVHPEFHTIVSVSRMPDGFLRMYGNVLTSLGSPEKGNYVLGVDVGLGLGGERGSNSTISILNRHTGRKVGEFISALTPPDRLANITIALARWFCSAEGNEAYVIFEANGPGQTFGRQIEDSSFGNVHYRINAAIGKGKSSRVPGWWSSTENKQILLGKYRTALEIGLFENPSRAALEETQCYKILPGGRIGFKAIGRQIAKEGESHADIVISDALAFYGAEELGGGPGAYTLQKKSKSIDIENAPRSSFGYRRYEFLQRRKNTRKQMW